MILLYSHSGDCLGLGSEAWSDLLALARRHGWSPSGTAQPPQCIDVDRPLPEPAAWTREYEPALGQMVMREDAQAMGLALTKARLADRSTTDRVKDLEMLLRFCTQGGFLICPEPVQTADSGFRDSLLGLHGALEQPVRIRPAVTARPATAPLQDHSEEPAAVRAGSRRR